MNLCNSFFSLPRQKVFNILFIVLKEVFCQHSRANLYPGTWRGSAANTLDLVFLFG